MEAKGDVLVLGICCCVTNYPKLNNLKQQIFIISQFLWTDVLAKSQGGERASHARVRELACRDLSLPPHYSHWYSITGAPHTIVYLVLDVASMGA